MILAHADLAEIFTARCARERARYPLPPMPERTVPETPAPAEELPAFLRRQAE